VSSPQQTPEPNPTTPESPRNHNLAKAREHLRKHFGARYDARIRELERTAAPAPVVSAAPAPAAPVNASARIQLAPLTAAPSALSADDLERIDNLAEVVADLDKRDEATAAIYEDDSGVVSFRGQKYPKGDPVKIATTLKLFENRRAKKAARTREKTRLRVEKLRAKRAAAKGKKAASPVPSKLAVKAMLSTLKIAIKKRAPTDRFLQNLIGREQELVRFRIIMLAGDFPDRVFAKRYSAATGTVIDRHQALRLRHIVERLLAPGGVWHR
jgi:hypothetical protein